MHFFSAYNALQSALYALQSALYQPKSAYNAPKNCIQCTYFLHSMHFISALYLLLLPLPPRSARAPLPQTHWQAHTHTSPHASAAHHFPRAP